MKTKTIGSVDIFKNIFTQQGRQKNKIYNELKNRNCKNMLETSFADGTIAGTGDFFKKNSVGNCTCILQPNGKILKKISEVQIRGLSKRNAKRVSIKKILTDINGKIQEELTKNICYEDDKICIKDITKIKNGEITKREKMYYFGSVTPSLVDYNKSNHDVYRAKEFSTKNGAICLLEHLDGNKTFVKQINGINYFFTTKK